MDWIGVLLLLVAGLVAGIVNVLAGGGSLLTLPVLMFLGLPAGVANGTNRIGILAQNVGAVWSFDRDGVLDRGSLWWAALPSTLGAALGAWGALVVSDLAFKRILAFLMVAIALWSLWSGRREAAIRVGEGSASRDPRQAAAAARPPGPVLYAAFFGVGIYGGFIQAGAGFLFLAVTTLAGLDLVRGNAVKVLSVLCLTALSLAIFAVSGRVEWLPGLALAAGNLIGGLLGAHWTVLKGHRWVRRFVTATILVFALKLLLD